MRISFTTLILFAFAGIAVFGAFAMNHGGGHGSHAGCIAAAANNTACPEEGNTFSFLDFHFGALRNFTSATFPSSLSFAAFLILFALGAGMALFGRGFAAGDAGIFGLTAQRRFEYKAFSIRRVFSHWLALHENSPGAR